MDVKLTEQEIIRREKLNTLREKGIDPFGHRFDRTSNSKKIKELSKPALSLERQRQN